MNRKPCDRKIKKMTTKIGKQGYTYYGQYAFNTYHFKDKNFSNSALQHSPGHFPLHSNQTVKEKYEYLQV